MKWYKKNKVFKVFTEEVKDIDGPHGLSCELTSGWSSAEGDTPLVDVTLFNGKGVARAETVFSISEIEQVIEGLVVFVQRTKEVRI